MISQKKIVITGSILISVTLTLLSSVSYSGSNTDDKDGDPCKGSDSCKEICKAIYDYEDIAECGDEGRDKVIRLYKVYKHLKSGDYSELENISEKLYMDDFEDYLKVGSSGWVKVIKDWGDSTPEYSKLTSTLKWLIDKQNVADVLKDNDGHDIFKELLVQFNKISTFNPAGGISAGNKINANDNLISLQNCDTDNTYDPPTYEGYDPPTYEGYDPPTYEGYDPPTYEGYDPPTYEGYDPPTYEGYDPPTYAGYDPPTYEGYDPPTYEGYDPPTYEVYEPPTYEVAGKAQNMEEYALLCIVNKGSNKRLGKIKFNNDQDRILYRSLAYLSLDNNSENVFSYSLKKDNNTILNMAYSLLNNTCTRDGTSTENQSRACKRALFCWMHASPSIDVGDDLEEWVKNQDGKACTPEEFSKYF